MPAGTRAFVLAQIERDTRNRPTELPIATITAIAPGGGTDSQTLVTVDYQGASLALPHMDHYTPAVGARVALAKIGGVWTILGRPIGHPA
jgi:hypothetical protein